MFNWHKSKYICCNRSIRSKIRRKCVLVFLNLV
uniref:Uncharacterized protein n=1 Tax=viral metagenome TaxID=1070528 RepID=A0A6C0EFV5_9ZZZZ